MKITFYLVRHGETLFNHLGRMQGSCDSPLTERGIAQAHETSNRLKDVWFDHIYSSPSERAWNTADKKSVNAVKAQIIVRRVVNPQR